jgi:anaerobic magnesium-protoporphyrin IX monomethyl ester cyclase
MIRVLFIIPPHSTRKTAISDGMPLGVLYLASMIENISEIRILDLYSFPQEDEPEKHLDDFSPDIVCISIPFKLVEKTAIDLSKRVSNLSDAKIIVGGLHATFAADRILHEIECDYFVKGEGEYAIRAIVGMPAGTSDIPDGKFVKSKINDMIILESGMVDINSLPFPARHLLSNRQNYSERLLTSRGCGFNCGFCSSQKFWGSFRGRNRTDLQFERISACQFC